MTALPAPKVQSPPRRRLSPAERERDIVAGAVAFFAEHGFDGATRDLARRLGITQPLLYRYFPGKDALLDRVYQEVYQSRWRTEWETEIADRSVSIDERLKRFYRAYAALIQTYEWVRLFMFAGLKGLDFNSRYLAFLRARLFDRIVMEIRAAHGLDETAPVTEAEIELIWSLHAAIFYIGVRKFIYGMPIPADLDADIDFKVNAFLHGAPAAFAAVLPQPALAGKAGARKK
ncbi:TetR/AcrR family transcriptional regulator [Xanthobacter autotrophicus]|jgi:AcrR family transcriptional regulator|uniref:TetR/AcrR family transcriptional regulator n=1 Tax=Xanthobacter autotrophicus TaxID=280 RepID=A0A6C1KR12_XANAU|nr:TetR/AcrR family transcriptional regulator [Xanthobacter autotrophicus]